MNKKIRKAVYDKTGGKCAYCGVNLPIRWHCDHIKPVHRNHRWDHEKRKYVYTGEMGRRENDIIENLLPSCPSCNIFKTSFPLEVFRTEIKKQVERLNQYSNQYRIAKRFGLIEETKKQIVFYFERIGIDVNL